MNESSIFPILLEDAKKHMIKRPEDSHKGTFGNVLLIAGSFGMAGAAYLSAMGAFRMGCGLVKIYTPECNRVILQTLLPEAMITSYDPCNISFEILQQSMNWCDIIGIGPGLGMEAYGKKLLAYVLKNSKVPVIIDGDGLNHLSKHIDLLSQSSIPIILTPHLKEMSRLLNCNVNEIKHNKISCAKQFSEKYNVSVVLKDSETIISYLGKRFYRNTTGNSGMAKGGSGDILTGMICGLSAYHPSLEEAIWMAVCFHGAAGDLAAEKLGETGMLARDLLDQIPYVVRSKENG